MRRVDAANGTTLAPHLLRQPGCSRIPERYAGALEERPRFGSQSQAVDKVTLQALMNVGT